MNSRKRPHGEHGAVSVYFMIVLSALLLFQAVLLDLARLHAAKHRAQQAVDAAMRSVYAGFDPKLQKYGLYGVDIGAAAEEAFRRC